MRKLFIAFLLVILPSACLAQTAESPAVGTCRQIGTSGYWQKLSDFSWAEPSDKLNSCQTNGFANNSLFGYSNTGNQYQNNQALGQMTSEQWYSHCYLSGTILPLPECQGYNPGFPNNGGLFNYPQLGRDYLSITNANSSVYVDLSSSENKWRDALIGVGMGWLLNRLTS